VCALLDLSIERAAERFLMVNGDLAANPRASISVGLAELVSHESLDDLIARADAALIAQRQERRQTR
jgi:PleD family two-component response regulator